MRTVSAPRKTLPSEFDFGARRFIVAVSCLPLISWEFWEQSRPIDHPFLLVSSAFSNERTNPHLHVEAIKWATCVGDEAGETGRAVLNLADALSIPGTRSQKWRLPHQSNRSLC